MFLVYQLASLLEFNKDTGPSKITLKYVNAKKKNQDFQIKFCIKKSEIWDFGLKTEKK